MDTYYGREFSEGDVAEKKAVAPVKADKKAKKTA